MRGIKILGVGSYYPDNIVNNFTMSELVETSDEWIQKRTGIKERRISNGEGSAEMGAKAALKALKASNINLEEIDLIIAATTSPDSFIPSTACLIQDIIGCKNARAFDISAACSGFIFSLITANSFIKSGESKKALIVGTEVLSRIIDWNDRNTCVLFGDGAGAAVLEVSSEKNAVIATHFGSDGTKGKSALTTGYFSVNSPFAYGKEDVKEEPKVITMDGRAIFKFAVGIIPETVEALLEKSGESLDNIKYIVPHQANMRIVEAASNKLNIPMDRFYINLDRMGNTSAASIPIALSEMVEKKLIERGDKIILVGFGGGLTWGGVILEW